MVSGDCLLWVVGYGLWVVSGDCLNQDFQDFMDFQDYAIMVDFRINITLLNCRRELRFPTRSGYRHDQEIAPTK